MKNFKCMSMIFITLTSLFTFLSSDAFSKSYTIGKSDSNKATFATKVFPNPFTINGTGGFVEGSMEMDGGFVSGEFKVDMRNIETDSELRDRHMREKMNVDKYPYVVLSLDKVKHSESEFDFTGNLTIQNETKPTKGKASIKNGMVKATFKIDFADYPSIQGVSYKGMTLSSDIDVDVEFKY